MGHRERDKGEVRQGTGDGWGNADGLLGKEFGRNKGPHAGVEGVKGSVVALERHGLEEDQAVVFTEEVDLFGRVDCCRSPAIDSEEV